MFKTSFQRLQHAEAALQADLQTSEEWLKSHSIEYMKLTLKDLVDKGKVSGYGLNVTFS